MCKISMLTIEIFNILRAVVCAVVSTAKQALVNHNTPHLIVTIQRVDLTLAVTLIIKANILNQQISICKVKLVGNKILFNN